MNKIGIFLVIIAVLCFVTAVIAFVLSFFGWQDPFTYGDSASLTIILGFVGFSLGLSLAALSELIAWIFQSLVRPR